MNYFDNENKIIEWFQNVEPSSVYFPIETNELVSLFESIHNEEKWKRWINSSRKSDPPPDFYCNELKLMMDVMRVDDHTYRNKKGKFINPTNARESRMQKELQESGILNLFPNVKNVICNAVTDLPTEQDHNFKFYKNNFARAIDDHKSKIDLYKKNHPGYKIIFFILDESSAYFEIAENVKPNIKKGEIAQGRPHIHFLDRQFLQVIDHSEIDYLIWYAPYKMINLEGGNVYDMPRAAIYDCSQMDFECLEYDNNRLVSVEE